MFTSSEWWCCGAVVSTVWNNHLLSAGAACCIHPSIQWSLDTAWLCSLSASNHYEVCCRRYFQCLIDWSYTHLLWPRATGFSVYWLAGGPTHKGWLSNSGLTRACQCVLWALLAARFTRAGFQIPISPTGVCLCYVTLLASMLDG